MVKKVVNFFGISKSFISCDVCKEKLFHDDDEPVFTYLIQGHAHWCWKCLSICGVVVVVLYYVGVLYCSSW